MSFFEKIRCLAKPKNFQPSHVILTLKLFLLIQRDKLRLEKFADRSQIQHCIGDGQWQIHEFLKGDADEKN